MMIEYYEELKIFLENKKEGLWKEYLEEIFDDVINEYIKNGVSTVFFKYIKKNRLIFSAFNWEKTKKGFKFWRDINTEWIIYLENNKKIIE